MQQHEAIQAVLPEGWRVRFQHERPRVMVATEAGLSDPSLVWTWSMGLKAVAYRWALRSHKGGRTICVISDASGRVMSVGYAYCSPKDNYCKRTGRELAFDRAAFGAPVIAGIQRSMKAAV